MVEAREHARLGDERLEPCLEQAFLAVRAQVDARAVAASGEAGRHVFLDRDEPLLRGVARQVHDTEAAFAEHADELELVQPRAGLERRAVFVDHLLRLHAGEVAQWDRQHVAKRPTRGARVRWEATVKA